MVSQELLDYVKKELSRGVHEDKLRQVLLEHDWPEFEINEAFEKAKEAKSVEEVPKETVSAEQKKPEEKSFKEFLEGLGKEKPELKEGVKPEEKPEEIKKVSVIGDVQKIVTNKIFIIAAVIIILGSIAFFILPSVFESEEGFKGAPSDVIEEAKKACNQYCNSNLCGLFVSPDFPQLELQGKNCLGLGVQCSRCE